MPLLAPVTTATFPSSRRSTATPSVSLQRRAGSACSLAGRAVPVGELDRKPDINAVEDLFWPSPMAGHEAIRWRREDPDSPGRLPTACSPGSDHPHGSPGASRNPSKSRARRAGGQAPPAVPLPAAHLRFRAATSPGEGHQDDVRTTRAAHLRRVRPGTRTARAPDVMIRDRIEVRSPEVGEPRHASARIRIFSTAHRYRMTLWWRDWPTMLRRFALRVRSGRGFSSGCVCVSVPRARPPRTA